MTTPNIIGGDNSRLREFQAEQQKTRKAMDERARRFRMLEAVRTVLQRTDRIVTGRGSLKVTLSNDYRVPAPSWTDGESVFLNKSYIEKDLNDPRIDLPKFVIRWKGANYHEVAHILLSPRNSDPLTAWLRDKVKTENDKRWWYAYNALEDQRIETQYTTLYTPTTAYFTQTVLHFLLRDTSSMGRQYPLIHGRKYLTPKLRRAVREPFIQLHGRQLAEDFASVIDEYLTLVLPRDDMRARKLIALYYQLMTSSAFGSALPDLSCGDNGGGKSVPGYDAPNTPKKGKPRTSEQKRAAKKIADRMEDDDLDAEDGDDVGDEGDDTDEEGENEGESADGAPGGESEAVAPTPVRDHQSQEEELPGGDAAHEINEQVLDVSADDLRDAIQAAENEARAAVSEMEHDPNVAIDVQDTCKSITSAAKAEGNVATDNYGHHRLEDATPEALHLARKVENVIRSIQLDLEPQWNRGEPVGRINGSRYFIRKADKGLTDIFDQWDEGGEDESGIEAVVLIDLSASMTGQIVGASRSLWAIKRAFDAVSIRTTVIGFSDSHVVLYKPTDKAPRAQTPLFSVISGTHPNSALREAYNILSRSQEPNRILFAITDGAWQGDADEQNTIIAALRRTGCITTLLAIGHSTLTWGGGHGMEVAMTIEKIEELPQVIFATVKQLLKKVQMH